MKRTLFLLLFYLSLTVTVGKHVRAIGHLFSEKSFSTRTFFFDFSDAEGSEETDSEDSEDRDFENNEDQEVTHLCFHSEANQVSIALLQSEKLFSNFDKEIGTPPPRF